mgnify:FL=1
MNIVVIGAGGVGGYFGGKLAKAGFDVTFIARGKHLEAIKERGLQVKSILGDFIVYTKATDKLNEIKNPDLVILGVKSWQVLGVAQELKSVITPRTMVLPLQNGADNADTLLSVLPKEHVLAGLSKIVSKVESPGVINHFAFEPEIFDYLDAECVLEQAPLARLAAEGQLAAFRHEGFWQPMDTFREYQMLNEMWDDGTAPWKKW